MNWVLEVMNGEVEATVFLNGRLMFAGKDQESKTTQMRISHLLKPGKNLLKVDVEPFKDETSSPNFKLTVLGGEKGTMPGEEAVVLKVESANFHPQFFAKTSNYVEEFSFEVEKEDSPLEMYQAESVSNFDEFFLAAKKLVGNLHSALVKKDLEEIKEMLHMRNKELAAVSKMEVETFEQGMNGFLQSLFSSDNWRVKELDYGLIQYDIESDGRVIHLYSDVTKPLIEANGAGRVFDLDVRIAQIGNKRTFVY